MPEYEFALTHIFLYKVIIVDFVQENMVQENPHCHKCYMVIRMDIRQVSVVWTKITIFIFYRRCDCLKLLF